MKKLYLIPVVFTGAVIAAVIAGCNADKDGTIETETVQTEYETDEDSGKYELVKIESEDFYIGTWKCIFYYDTDEDKIESMEDEDGYYVTFSGTDMIISDNGEVESHEVTTSDGIQTNSSGADYYCLYYNTELNTQVTTILTMMKITGEEESGIEDGEYLNVMFGNDDHRYMVFEKVNG